MVQTLLIMIAVRAALRDILSVHSADNNTKSNGENESFMDTSNNPVVDRSRLGSGISGYGKIGGLTLRNGLWVPLLITQPRRYVPVSALSRDHQSPTQSRLGRHCRALA